MQVTVLGGSPCFGRRSSTARYVKLSYSPLSLFYSKRFIHNRRFLYPTQDCNNYTSTRSYDFRYGHVENPSLNSRRVSRRVRTSNVIDSINNLTEIWDCIRWLVTRIVQLCCVAILSTLSKTLYVYSSTSRICSRSARTTKFHNLSYSKRHCFFQ